MLIKLFTTFFKIGLFTIGGGYVMIPVIQKQETFQSKVGDENRNMMFNFKDRGDRDLCLAPEYTAVVQQLAKEKFKFTNNAKMFYIGECFRGENKTHQEQAKDAWNNL